MLPPFLIAWLAEELAQKYQEKALARRRGAGTHQPKFRGFTVGRKSEVNSVEDATVPQTTTVITLRHETQSAELQTTIPEVSQDSPPLTNLPSSSAIPMASKRRRTGSPSLPDPPMTTANKPVAVPVKRRRLIREETEEAEEAEEADENDYPLPLHSKQTTTARKDTARGAKKLAPDKQGNQDTSTDVNITRTKKSKGSSRTTSQLQIHCLKFWGPFSALGRPATAKKKKTTKKPPVQGEPSTSQEAGLSQKVQSILQFEDAPLSEMDVIADAVRDVVDTFIDSIEDKAMAKELMIMRSELETVLIEQVDMLDDHILLKASVKKAAAVKKELRVRLLETQRQRQKTREELKRVRANFEREERARRRLEDTHNFLTDLEALRDHIVGSDDESADASEDERTKDHEDDNLKTGLQSLIATVGSRCGKPATGGNTNTPSHMLKTLREFNQLLEETGKNLQ
ncbi:MAG: hypothetical protein J3Q66DRAFT_209847 [Benniella sp.]|nr:MAG: hypothetical protein J3Q66DRAFT_209847 [Benniella sp.]